MDNLPRAFRTKNYTNCAKNTTTVVTTFPDITPLSHMLAIFVLLMSAEKETNKTEPKTNREKNMYCAKNGLQLETLFFVLFCITKWVRCTNFILFHKVTYFKS